MKASKIGTLLIAATTALVGLGAYRNIGSSTTPNTWTSNYWGVLSEAEKTGYPIIYIDVNSSTCGHCHTLNSLTLSSAEFKALENDLVAYLVMTDDASSRTAGGARLYDVFESYYGGGQYPIIAVVANNGTVYGYFNNFTTDTRNVASDIRKMVEELSIKQTGQINYTDGTSAAGTPTPAPAPVVYPTTLAGWTAFLKGRANGIALDANGSVAGTLALNATARGKVTAKVVTLGGRANIKAEMTLDAEGNPAFSGSGLAMTYDKGSSTWVGEYNGGKALASKVSAKGFDGLYTTAAKSSAGTSSGYLTLTAKNGKGRVMGILNGNNKVSVNGAGVVLPAKVVAENIKDWNIATDIAVYPVLKANKGISGCVIAAKGGAAAGTLKAFGGTWVAEGAKWNTATSLAPLNGKSLKVGEYEIPVTVSGGKLAAGVNAYKARIQAQAKKGIFKGMLKLASGNLRFEGALLGSGAEVHGSGVSFGAGVFPVTLGPEEDCSECTVRDE